MYRADTPRLIETRTLKPQHADTMRVFEARNQQRGREIDELLDRLRGLGCDTSEVGRPEAAAPPNEWFDVDSRLSYENTRVTIVFTPDSRLAALLRTRGASLR
jgi:hypothetical protein